MPRLWVVLARESPRAVIFRRGPSKQVLLISWDTAADRFEHGQWLRGRIYERRSDLSPDGELLVYFAATWRGPYQTWTAISRPPFLTALALWPKGNAFGGGGQFRTKSVLELNHQSLEMQLAEPFELPTWFRVEPCGPHSGWGEDHPLWEILLNRDGWTCVRSNGEESWEKQRGEFVLDMTIRAVGKRQAPWYTTEYALVSLDGRVAAIGAADWADWLHDGDLAFAKDGRLYRVDAEAFLRGGEPRVIADFSALTFERREAPAEMTQWPRLR